MATTKSAGAAKRNVDIAGKRLGIKKFGGEYVKPGNIVLRQRGTKFHPGNGTDMGKDHTIFAVTEGFVFYKRMTGYKRTQKSVHITKTNEHDVNVVRNASAVKNEELVKPVKKVKAKVKTAGTK